LIGVDASSDAALIKRLTPAVWSKWDGKLYNWALCYGTKEDRGGNVSGAYDALEEGERTGRIHDEDAFRADTWEAPEPPGITVEAMDTHALVVMLPAERYDAVRAYWGGIGPLYLRADAIGVHENTLRNRAKAAVVALETRDGARQRGERITSSPAVVIRTRYVPRPEAD